MDQVPWVIDLNCKWDDNSVMIVFRYGVVVLGDSEIETMMMVIRIKLKEAKINWVKKCLCKRDYGI